MQRKWVNIAIVCIMCFLLTACNIQSVDEYEKQQTQEQSVKEQHIKEQSVKETKEAEETKKTTTTPEVTKTNLETSETKQPQTIEQKQQATKQTTTTTVTTEKTQTVTTKTDTRVPVKNDNEQAQKTKVTEQQTPTVIPPVEKKRYVTIGIYVKTLLANKDLLDAPLRTEKYVPSNGVVLETTKYELLHDNETVWDVLVRATKEHSIHLEYQGANDNAYKSVYIEGINHLYEFSAGELSGWMYSVNGVFPKYGCSQYTLKEGDVIEWHYTVDLGRDLGQQVAGG